MSANHDVELLISVKEKVKEREQLLLKAADLLKKSEHDLKEVLKSEGLTEEYLDMVRQNLPENEKQKTESMRDKIDKEIREIAKKKFGSPGEEPAVPESSVDSQEVPLDALLKGSLSAAGDKKIKRKKKKTWI